MTTNLRENYHHGDLAQQLIDLAIREISESGTEKLSLRSIAREAGVSQTAPYRHFPTKNCLLAAIATQGFNQLRNSLEQEVAAAADLEDAFIRIGVAYVRFARSHSTEYHLMFGGVLADFSEYEMLQTASMECFNVLKSVLEALKATRGLEIGLAHFTGAVWSVVHGLSSLQINLENSDPETSLSPRSAIKALHDRDEETLRFLLGGILSQQ